MQEQLPLCKSWVSMNLKFRKAGITRVTKLRFSIFEGVFEEIVFKRHCSLCKNHRFILNVISIFCIPFTIRMVSNFRSLFFWKRKRENLYQKLRREGLGLHRLLAPVQHNSCCYATIQHLMTSFCNI